jgi:hypothetical protein
MQLELSTIGHNKQALAMAGYFKNLRPATAIHYLFKE